MKWPNLILWLGLSISVTRCSEHPPGNTAPPPGKSSSRAGREVPPLGELVAAAAQNDSARIERLLERGSDINENIGVAGIPVTPLLAAIAMRNAEAALKLISHGASTRFNHRGHTTKALAMHAFGTPSDVVRAITLQFQPAAVSPAKAEVKP